MNEGEVLDRRRTAVIAIRGPARPLAALEPYWFDGAHVWLAARQPTVQALLTEPVCTVFVPPGEGEAVPAAATRAAGDRGVVLTASARIFGASDVVGLAVHAGPVATAMAALSARWAPALARTLPSAVRALPALLAGEGAALDAVSEQVRTPVRLAVQRLRPATAPPYASGPAPGLPSAVPAGVRRRLAGRRFIALVVDHPGPWDADRGSSPAILSAAWTAGFRVHAPAGVDLPDGQHVVAAVAADDPGLPLAGLALGGILSGGRLHADAVVWWLGARSGSAALGSSRPGGDLLPD